MSATSFIGGGQIGYNWQHGNFVYGLEGDFSGLTGQATVGTPGKGQYTAKINWLSTLRGRTGIAIGDTMAYMTGGLAIGGVKDSFGFTGFSPANKSISKTAVGWTIGGGVEHMLDQHWTVGLEALFVDLGNSKLTLQNPGRVAKTGSFSNQAVIGRLRLGYKW
jgi:outer membrane immunogenic protein